MQWTLRVLVFLLLRIWSSSFSHRSLSQVWVPPFVFVHLRGCHGGIWHESNLFRMKFLLRKRSLRRLRLVRIASALVWAASLLVQVDVIFLEEAFIAKKNGHSDSDEKLTILSALYLMPSAGLGPQQVDLRFALQILFLEWARWRFILSEFSQPASLTWRFCWQRPCFCHSHAAARGWLGDHGSSPPNLHHVASGFANPAVRRQGQNDLSRIWTPLSSLVMFYSLFCVSENPP